MRVAGHGYSIQVPAGWEARIRKRGAGPVLHVATFPLHASDGDFGAAATDRMATGDSFAALVEYVDPEKVKPGVGLFAPKRPPVPKLREFAPMQLQVTRPGQLGWQRFFTEQDRTCCLYAVIKPGRERPQRLVARLAAVLETLRLSA
ncbi:MAG TPA: hypothetical protein VMV16_04280 [Solirubrobacteraceae bacterium]|nr:hypothetical protein [Solirubrobacteraceae bacterium]